MAIDEYLNRREKQGWKKTRIIDISVDKGSLVKGLIVAAFITVFAALILMFFLGMRGNFTEKHMWFGETEATITEFEICQTEDGQRYAYIFEYEVDGQKYEGKDYQNRMGPNERRMINVDIVYNENNPSEFVVSSSDAITLYFQATKASWGFFLFTVMIPCYFFMDKRSKWRRINDAMRGNF